MNPIGKVNSKEVRDIILRIASEENLPEDVVKGIVESQFSMLREAIVQKKNIRLLRLTMFYNRLNKNPEYLKMKENERRECDTDE